MQNQNIKLSLYVSDLPQETTENDLKNFFAKYKPNSAKVVK